MKLSLFCNCRYLGPSEGVGWPVPADDYSPEAAEYSYETALSQAEMVDQLGWDWVSVAEHHYAPFSIAPNPMVLAGAVTQRVKRAKVALLGPDLPILNPIRVAEEFAMLDTLSNGRVIAGLMRGTPNEYVTYNINPDESRGRFQEGLELIKMAWTEKQPFGWQGRYFQYRTISIWPRPVQDPHPPMFMSGSSPESAAFAARNRVSLGFAVTTVQAAGKSAAYYREQCAEAGWEPTPDDVLYRMTFHISDTDEQAEQDLRDAGASRFRGISMLNQDLMASLRRTGYFSGPEHRPSEKKVAQTGLQERIDSGQILIGGPETVIKQIRRVKEELGAGILDLTAAIQIGDKTTKSIELMSEKVLPEIRGW